MSQTKYRVLEQVLVPQRHIGGRLTFITGEQGSGKTTLMLNWAHVFVDRGDIVIWRGLFSGQAFKFYSGDIAVLLSSKYNYQPFRLGAREYEPLNWTDLGVRYIETFDDIRKIESLAMDGVLNVVYMGRDDWREFLSMLPKLRRYAFWLSIFIDEFENIAPHHPRGDMWRILNRMVDGLAEFRKRYINLIVATQQPTNVYWLVRKQFQYRVVLPGTDPEDDLPLLPQAIRALKRGEAWIVSSGWYEKFTFPPLEPKFDFEIHIEGEGG